MISNGLPPPTVFDTYDHLPERYDAFDAIPIELRFRRKMSQTVAASILELGRTALSVAEPGGATALSSVMEIFAWQLTQLETECPDRLSCSNRPIKSFTH